MERYLPFPEAWSVTARVHGPINKPSAQEIAKLELGVDGYPEDLQVRLRAALTVIYALRLCQPDFFAEPQTELEIEKTVGLAARQTVENYRVFTSKENLKEETKDLDDSGAAVLGAINNIVEEGKFSSDVRGLSEAIVRHIHKQHRRGSDCAD